MAWTILWMVLLSSMDELVDGFFKWHGRTCAGFC